MGVSPSMIIIDRQILINYSSTSTNALNEIPKAVHIYPGLLVGTVYFWHGLREFQSYGQLQMSKVIYITSIPYDKTEEQVLDIAKSVGPVVSSKLLFDRETGKSRGVCLVEYPDYETASSAVRNLNNFPVSGGDGSKGGMMRRYLKCNFASESTIIRLLNGEGWNGGRGYGGENSGDSRYELEREIPPLPAGVNVMDSSMDGLNAAIYQALANINEPRMKNLVRDAKVMSDDNPELMEVLLETHPQLIYALVQGAMLLNLASPAKIKELLAEQVVEKANLENSAAESTDNVKDQAPEAKESKKASSDASDEQVLTDEQRNVIKAICAMSEEEIKKSVTDPQQQKLYLEIKNRYSSTNL